MSILTVVVPASADARMMVTGATAMAMLGDVKPQEESLIDAEIRRASAAIEQYCNRIFAAETVSETFRLDDGARSLLLTRRPIISVTSITEDGVALAGSDWEADLDAGILFRLGSDAQTDWSASKVTIVYQAGYNSYPKDLQDAALRLVRMARASRSRDPTIKSETVEGVGQTVYWISGSANFGSMPPDVTGILDQYCDIRA